MDKSVSFVGSGFRPQPGHIGQCDLGQENGVGQGVVSQDRSASDGLCCFISSRDGDSIYRSGLCDIKLVAV